MTPNERQILENLCLQLDHHSLIFTNTLDELLRFQLSSQGQFYAIDKKKIFIGNQQQIFYECLISIHKSKRQQPNVEYLNSLQLISNIYSFRLEKQNPFFHEVEAVFQSLVMDKKVTLSQILFYLEDSMAKHPSSYFPSCSFGYKIFLIGIFISIWRNLDLKILLAIDLLSLSKKFFDFFIKITQNSVDERFLALSFEFFELFLHKFQYFDEEGNFSGEVRRDNLAAFYSAPMEASIQSFLQGGQMNEKLLTQSLISLEKIFHFVKDNDFILLQ